MAIVINGSGTVTGLAVGGLPDGTVDEGTLATDSVTAAKIPASLENTFVSGRKNMVINGAMNVAQRATSSTGITAGGYDTVDRFITEITTLGTWSISQSTDAPDGFAYSLFHDCTTADASPASGDVFRMSYRFEGQDLQHLQKGTSSAKSCTVSFWIKSNKTGTGQFNIRDIDNTRGINKTYTINSADTWEYKTITIQGDTTGAISNDNGSSFWLMWLFNSGTNNSSGTFNSDWHAWDWTDINASGTLDIGASTSDYVKITGVQLELGDTATDFEHRSYGEELALCQRYYQTSGAVTFWALSRYSAGSGTARNWWQMSPTMRAAPSVSSTGTWSSSSGYSGSLTYSSITTEGFTGVAANSSSANGVVYAADGTINMDAEL